MKDSVVIETIDNDWTKVSALLYDDNASMVTQLVVDVGHRTDICEKYRVVGELFSGELVRYKEYGYDESSNNNDIIEEMGLDLNEEWEEE